MKERERERERGRESERERPLERLRERQRERERERGRERESVPIFHKNREIDPQKKVNVIKVDVKRDSRECWHRDL